MERRMGFKEERPEGLKYNTLGAQAPAQRNSPLPLGGSTHTLPDYSWHLHLSTSARDPLKIPATLHSSASLAIDESTADLEGSTLSNTISLRCRQRHQQTRATPVQRSRSTPGPPCLSCSQPTKLVSTCSIHSSFPHQRRQVAQTSRDNTQPMRKWSNVSSLSSQKGHAARCGRRRLLSLSAVQHLFLLASQKKTLQFGRVLERQI
jgi:hypothetical protein